MAAIKMPISNVKLLFYPPCKVKCGLENSVSTKCPSLTKLEKWMSMYENDKLCNQYLTMVNVWWMQIKMWIDMLWIKMWTESWGRLPTFLLVRGSGPNVVYACSIFFFFFWVKNMSTRHTYQRSRKVEILVLCFRGLKVLYLRHVCMGPRISWLWTCFQRTKGYWTCLQSTKDF